MNALFAQYNMEVLGIHVKNYNRINTANHITRLDQSMVINLFIVNGFSKQETKNPNGFIK